MPKEGAMDKSMSESNLLGLQDSTPPNFVSVNRNKRRREEISNLALDDFKEEIRSMIKTMLSTQVSELQKISASQLEIQQTNLNIESSMAFLTAQNEEFRKKIGQMEQKIETDGKYIAVLEDRIEDLQRGTKKSNFEMKNVPKKNGENKDDLIDMVMKLSDSDMKSDIKDIYRVRGSKEKTYNTPIIVEMTSTILKTEVIKMCKSYNIRHKAKICAKNLGITVDGDTPVYISEQLTARGSRLHYLARDLAKSKAYKHCWTAYGKVYVRKDDNTPIITIHSEAQVQQLMQM